MSPRQDSFEEPLTPEKRRLHVGMYRVCKGEWISCIAGILLFVFMFLTWFDVKATNTSNLLFAVQSVEPGKNAWEALDFLPVVLLITILAALAVGAHRFVSPAARRLPVSVNAVVALLGIVSVLLILFRIIEPPMFHTERTVTYEGTVQPPIFLALLSAAGIAYGGYWAMREEGMSFADLRARRRRDQGRLRTRGDG